MDLTKIVAQGFGIVGFMLAVVQILHKVCFAFSFVGILCEIFNMISIIKFEKYGFEKQIGGKQKCHLTE